MFIGLGLKSQITQHVSRLENNDRVTIFELGFMKMVDSKSNLFFFCCTNKSSDKFLPLC